MTDRFPWRTALKIAWRESRAAPAKFAFVALAVSVGVAALTGVRGFSRSFRSVLLVEARTLMAADLTVRVFSQPDAAQTAVLDQLRQRGVRFTRITETVSMVSSAAVAEPLLVSIKAVDPAVYPFYGSVSLEPPGKLSERLTEDAVAVSEDLLIRLRVEPGDTVRLGGRDFRVAAMVAEEPDRMTGSFNIGPRLMMSREGLNRTGLITVGSRAAERFLLRLGPGTPPVGEVRTVLRQAFPRARIVDFRESHPLITRGLDDATVFLSLVSLIAMIVGAVGVATAMRSHLELKMDSIAVMKSIGATSGQVMRIYLLQTAILGLAGSLFGILLGMGIERIFPLLISRYFSIRPQWRLDPVPALQGLLIGLVITLLFTLPPLLRIRRIRPNVILRRDMPETRPGWRYRLRSSRASLLAAGLLLSGVGAVTAWLSESLQTAGLFVGGAMVCLSVMSGVAWALLASLKGLLGRFGKLLPVPLRYGLANLYRPGNHAGAVLVALGTGVMFTLTVFLVQRSLLGRILESAPPDMPNVFLVNITEAERGGLSDLIRRQPGVLQPPLVVASVEARLTAVDGVRLAPPAPREPGQEHDRRGRPDGQPRSQRSRSVTWAEKVPPDTAVVSGAWWSGPPWPADALVCVAEEEAQRVGVGPGSRLEFAAANKVVIARVACLYRTEAVRPGSSIDYIFSPGILDGLPTTYYGGVRVEPKAVGPLQRVVYERYPTVTVVNIADVLEIVQGVVDQVALVTRFVAAFTILAGAIILASSVAGTRFRRVREVAILKTVGATRRRIVGIISVEFLILGGVAGFMGSLLATGFSALALDRLFRQAHFRLDWGPTLAAITLAALVAAGAGWLASARILGRKPLEVLRGE
ncbi:MAG: ABC transporter permease [Bryobacteraceae bacterium]